MYKKDRSYRNRSDKNDHIRIWIKSMLDFDYYRTHILENSFEK